MTQSMYTLSGTNLLHTSHIRNRKIFLPYSPFHWGWYHFFYTLLNGHFWQTCWLSDTQQDAHRQNLGGRGMKFFPARSQGCKGRPVIGPDWASGSPIECWAWRLCCSSAPHWAHSPNATTLYQATSGQRKGEAHLTLFRPTKEASIVPWCGGGGCYSSVSMQFPASSWHSGKMGKEMK